MKKPLWSPLPVLEGMRSAKPYLLDSGVKSDLEAALGVAIRHYLEHEANMRMAVVKGSSEILTAESALDMAQEYSRKVEVLNELLYNIKQSEVRMEPR